MPDLEYFNVDELLDYLSQKGWSVGEVDVDGGG